MKKLSKSNKNKMIAGVCGGIAEYFNIDATVVRLAFGIVTLFWGAGVIFYILAAIIVPSAENNFSDDDDVDNLKSANIDDEGNSGDKGSKSKNGQGPHSDEEFDSYFKK